MVSVRIEQHPAFRVAGEKTYINGQDNAQFAEFWQKSHANGLIDRLRALSAKRKSGITRSDVIGVSRVEQDPKCRAFDFWIVAECDTDCGLDSFVIPACRWAIFSNRGDMPMALVDAEIYAFTKWLPASDYAHAHAPEIEVYPKNCEGAVEFWLPIEAK